ncbi:unnamed protein product, partial [Musa acuminata subsp. burmannicoides]
LSQASHPKQLSAIVPFLFLFGVQGRESYIARASRMANFGSFLSHLHSVAGPAVTLLYPLYASICAIESPSKNDDEQWLAYWILYSFLTLMEMVAEPILYWIPVWYQIKVIFVAWLVLPHFRGASFMYERFVREQLIKYGVKLGTSSPHNKKVDD